MTPRWLAIVWVLSALLVGLTCGLAMAHVGEDCTAKTADNGITVVQTCVREVTP